MGIITKMRKEKAVWWGVTALDEFGQPIFAEPLEIDCRWEDVLKIAINQEGDEFTSSSTVYVDREMVPGDWLWRGELAELPDGMEIDPRLDPPLGVDPARPIQGWEDMPKLSYKEHLLTALL